MLSKNILINDYLLSCGNLTFDELKFNEVDIAILGCLIYADFISLESFKKSLENKEDVLIKNYNSKSVITKLSQRYLNRKGSFGNFFENVINSVRFKDLVFTNIVNKLNDKEQFFAGTWLIDGKKIVVFRGTDNTVTGWKEDLLTAALDKVYAQVSALEYLKKATRNSRNKVYVVGHSKGGNLAYYSFFNLPEKNKNNVIKVYNLDGNGFKNDSFDYKKYKDKIIKIVPSDDVVGTVFDENKEKTIVKSNSFSVLAHDLLTWKIDPKKPNTFLREPELTDFSEAFSRSGNKWLKDLSDEDVSDFLDFIFKIAELNEPNTLADLLANILKNSKEYLKLIVNYSAEKRNKLIKLSVDSIGDFKNALYEVKKERRHTND